MKIFVGVCLVIMLMSCLAIYIRYQANEKFIFDIRECREKGGSYIKTGNEFVCVQLKQMRA